MFKVSFKEVFYLILYSIPNTVLSFLIIYIINNATAGNAEFLKDYMGIVFVSIIIYTYLLNIIFQKKLNEYASAILYDNEKVMFDKILKTSLIKLEKLGSYRFYTAIEDLRIFSSLPDVVTQTLNSLLMLSLCIIYLFALSFYAALILVVLILIIVGGYYLIVNVMSPKIELLRKYNEQYYNLVIDLIKGFKELKINFIRRWNLMQHHLNPNRDSARELDCRVNYVFLSINLISQYGLYLIIGAILFLLPSLDIMKMDDVISYVIILLFMTGPINNLLNMQNIYARFRVSNNRIEAFSKDFKEDKDESVVNLLEDQFSSLKFNNITFTYDTSLSNRTFTLGPVDITIAKGETIFLVGGNGSGKSTFINLLTGLYQPSKGEIILNGSGLDHEIRLQNLISAVFTDNHIFSENYDDYELRQNKEYQEWLQFMEMDTIVVDDTEESARRSFSKGQSKRMSLIFALLENKPILVLDEWAADQDPQFRKYFYERLLPILKKMGKTIIAVTHDDAYFRYAERVIKFDYGQIIIDKKVKDITSLASLWNS